MPETFKCGVCGTLFANFKKTCPRCGTYLYRKTEYPPCCDEDSACAYVAPSAADASQMPYGKETKGYRERSVPLELSCGLTFEGEEKGYVVAGTGRCVAARVSIPCEFLGEPVVGIGARAFSGNTRVEEIALPDTVTFLGEGAFQGCASLKTVCLPRGLKEIKRDAFRGCGKLVSIVFPSGLAIVGDFAFADCSSLEDVSLLGGVTALGEGVFKGCAALSRVCLPDGVSSIGKSAFEGCLSLKEVKIPDAAEVIDEKAFLGCTSLENVIWGKSLAEIRRLAFFGCEGLEFVALPRGVRELYDLAFGGCKYLKKILVPDTAARVSPMAFEGCGNLSAIYFTGNVSAWRRVFGNGLPSAGSPARLFCADTSCSEGCLNAEDGGSPLEDSSAVSLGSFAESLFDGAVEAGFERCRLAFKKTEGGYAVAGAGKCDCGRVTFFPVRAGVRVTLPTEHAGARVSQISSYAFLYEDSLAGVVIPGTVETVGRKAFYGCASLEEVVFSPGGRSYPQVICEGAFAECPNLKRVVLSPSVVRIEKDAFRGCAALEDVCYGGTKEMWENVAVEDGNGFLSRRGPVFLSDV